MRMSFSTYRKSLLRLAIFLWVGAFCVALIYGCYSYPNIEWAEREGILIHKKIVTKEYMAKLKESETAMGAYYGKHYNVHLILIRRWAKDSKYVLNHELGHARYPDRRHP